MENTHIWRQQCHFQQPIYYYFGFIQALGDVKNDYKPDEKYQYFGFLQALGDVEDDYKPDEDDFSDDDEMSKNLAKYHFGGFSRKEGEPELDVNGDENAPKFVH